MRRVGFILFWLVAIVLSFLIWRGLFRLVYPIDRVPPTAPQVTVS